MLRRFIDKLTGRVPASYSTVPLEPRHLDHSWHRGKGEDSLVCRLEHDGRGYVFKIAKGAGLSENEEAIARLAGPPSALGTVTLTNGNTHRAVLSEQVLMTERTALITSKSPQVPEERKVQIISNIMKEKIKTFLFLIQKGYLADFDPVNVGIGELQGGGKETVPAVFLVDYGGSIKLENPSQFMKIVKGLSKEDTDKLIGEYDSKKPFMSNSHLSIYCMIRFMDMTLPDRLDLSDEAKERIKQAVEEAYQKFEGAVAKNKNLPLPLASLCDKSLGLDARSIYEISGQVEKLFPELDIKTVCLKV